MSHHPRDASKIPTHPIPVSMPCAPDSPRNFDLNSISPRDSNVKPERAIELLEIITVEHDRLRSFIQEQICTLTEKIDKLNHVLPGQNDSCCPIVPVNLMPSSSSPDPCKVCKDAPRLVLPSDKFEAEEAPVNGLQLRPHHFRSKTAEFIRAPHVHWKRFVASDCFEIAMGFVILVNTCFMFAHAQIKGLHEASKLGLRDGDGDDWSNSERLFSTMEYVFISVYIIELCLRLVANGKQFLTIRANSLDLLVVLASCIELFVLRPLNKPVFNVTVLRLIRVCRMLRVGKWLRVSEHLSEMRILLATLRLAVRGVAWSFLLLTLIIGVGGMLMAQLALMYIDDDSLEYETRVWLYEYFGTFWRSMHTMFECTFTTSWPNVSRPLIENVSYKFAVFWSLWVLLVNFVTMRVVAALFLRETLKVAAADAERLAMGGLTQAERTADQIRGIFTAADTSGDGSLGKEEFDQMMSNPTCVAAFDKIGLDATELKALFTVFSSDDGAADFEEFLAGALKINNSAPKFDAVQNIYFHIKWQRSMDKLEKQIGFLVSRAAAS